MLSNRVSLNELTAAVSESVSKSNAKLLAEYRSQENKDDNILLPPLLLIHKVKVKLSGNVWRQSKETELIIDLSGRNGNFNTELEFETFAGSSNEAKIKQDNKAV
jgi:uncharacterized protein (DUF779 family)